MEHHLKFLKRIVGDWNAAWLTTKQGIEDLRRRRIAGTGAAAVNNDLIWLRSVLKTADRAALRDDLPVVVQRAVPESIAIVARRSERMKS